MHALSINRDPILNDEMPGFFNIKCALFVVDALQDIADMIVYYTYWIESFFSGAGGEFVLIVDVHGA